MSEISKIAVIPARGGSKRIIKKNIKNFNGMPIIAWPILSAKRAGIFDKIIVSTDNHEIAEVAKEYGADVPFVRPDLLSDDHATAFSVVQHCIKWFNKMGCFPEHTCCIYATAALIREDDLVSAFSTLKKDERDFVFAATEYDFPVQRGLKVTANGDVKMLHPELFATRSQDFESIFHDAGQFYWGRSTAWLDKISLFGDTKTGMYLLPRYRAIDIDNLEDWKLAELVCKSLVDDE